MTEFPKLPDIVFHTIFVSLNIFFIQFNFSTLFCHIIVIIPTELYFKDVGNYVFEEQVYFVINLNPHNKILYRI